MQEAATGSSEGNRPDLTLPYAQIARQFTRLSEGRQRLYRERQTSLKEAMAGAGAGAAAGGETSGASGARLTQRSRSPSPRARMAAGHEPGGSQTLALAPTPRPTSIPRPLDKRRLLPLYMKKDTEYGEALARQRELEGDFCQEKRRARQQFEIEEMQRLEMGPSWWGEGYAGYGNGLTGSRFKVVYPHERKRHRRHRAIALGAKLDGLRVKEEELVPIRLELEHEGHKFKETFNWNIQDRTLPVDLFAEVLCEDFHLPPPIFVPAITRSIQEQIAEYHGREWRVALNEAASREGLRGRDLCLLELKSEQGEAVESLKVPPSALDDELRILIKLDITVGVRQLTDQIEWDINNPANYAEDFAHSLATELGLGGEFTTAIAHSIREQSQIYTKSLVLTGHSFDGTPVADEDLKFAFLPPLSGPVVRLGDVADDHTPRLMELSDLEVDRLEKDHERESRRKRRQTRGRRGVLLPDREPLPTRRSTPAAAAAIAPTASEGLEDDTTQADPANLRRRRAPLPPPLPPPLASLAVPVPPPPAPPHAPVAISQHGLLATRGMINDSLRSASAGRGDELPKPQPLANAVSSGHGHSGLAPYAAGASPMPMAKDSPKRPQLPSEPMPEQIQHDNYIDGVWHCGNCGCPQTVAVGLRKGPRGDRTLCGACGKYYHRHRKSRPAVYNTDENYHRQLQLELQLQHRANERRRIAPVVSARPGVQGRDQLSAQAQAMMLKGQTPQPRFNSQIHLQYPTVDFSRSSLAPHRPLVPGSGRPTASITPQNLDTIKTEEAATGMEGKDAAQELQVDQNDYSDGYDDDRSPRSFEDPTRADSVSRSGSSSSASDSDDDDLIHRRPTVQVREPSQDNEAEGSGMGMGMGSGSGEEAPAGWTTLADESVVPDDHHWFYRASDDLLARHPGTRAALVPRRDGELRIRCLDCPGRVYVPGPGESLANFEIHLKNRVHRANVESRLRRQASAGGEENSWEAEEGGMEGSRE